MVMRRIGLCRVKRVENIMHQANLAEGREKSRRPRRCCRCDLPPRLSHGHVGRHDRRRRPARNKYCAATSNIFWFKTVSDSVVSTGSDRR